MAGTGSAVRKGIKPDDLESALSIFTSFDDVIKLQDQRLQEALSSVGINPTQCTYLFMICQDHAMNLGELAERLHVRKSTASVMLRRLEDAGMVSRKSDGQDSRMLRITPTPEGLAAFRRAKLIIADYFRQVFGDFSESEILELAAALWRIRDNIREYEPGNSKILKICREGEQSC